MTIPMTPERLVKRTVQFCRNIAKNGIQIPRKLDSVEAINLSMTEYDPVIKGVEALELTIEKNTAYKYVTDERNKLDWSLN